MAQVLLAVSGAGGAGKSTLCAFAGQELARRGRKVLLVEMCAGLRGLDLSLGLEGQVVYDLADLLLGRCPPEKAAIPHSRLPALQLIAAPADGDFRPGQQEFGNFLRWARELYDILLIDTPGSFGPGFSVPAACCDGALVVTAPLPVSMRGAGAVSARLREGGVTRQRLVINRIPRRLPPGGPRDLDEVIDRVGVQLIAAIPSDPAVDGALAAGGELPPASLAGRAFANLAARLCGDEVPLLLE